jgi:uncharacterized protein (DUF58 family)
MKLRVRPTWFGATLVVFLVAGRLLAPAASDPQVAGAAWAALAVLVVVGLVWPLASVASIRVRVVGSPTDATVGDVVALRVVVRGGMGNVQARLVAPHLPDGQAWQRIEGAVELALEATATRRCVADAADIEVRTRGPLDVATVRVVRRCRLPGTWWTAPRPTDERWTPEATSQRLADGSSRAASRTGDVVRSVRPYVVGDPAHLVHWPSSAHAGDLMVRELEPPAEVGLAIVVDLGDDPERAEAHASRAAGFVWAAHVAGGRVTLCTHDGSTGPRATEVVTTTEAGRLLAAATPGPPAPPPRGWPVLVVGP